MYASCQHPHLLHSMLVDNIYLVVICRLRKVTIISEKGNFQKLMYFRERSKVQSTLPVSSVLPLITQGCWADNQEYKRMVSSSCLQFSSSTIPSPVLLPRLLVPIVCSVLCSSMMKKRSSINFSDEDVDMHDYLIPDDFDLEKVN